MKYTINTYGHLLIELETAADKQWVKDTLASREGDDNLFLSDLLEYTGWKNNGQLMQLNPADIGALTQAPLLTDMVEYDEAGRVKSLGNLYWFPHYEGTHFGEHLHLVGYVGFTRTAFPDIAKFKNQVTPSRAAMRNVLEASQDIATNLAGYATKLAVQELTNSWVDALVDNNPEFYISSMHSDIDAVIENLQALKLGLSHNPEGGKQLMRKKLGLN